MDAREALFPTFPRTVGNPGQHIIYNRDELNWFATVNSGINDKCFCSICMYEGSQSVFTDLFLENDELNLLPIRKVAEWFDNHNIPWIVLFSGRVGFHFHGLFEPEIVQLKTVKKFAKLILEETKTVDNFDSHVTGDIKRLCRIPNTRRENGMWCIPLTREEVFGTEDINIIKRMALSPRFLDYNIGRRPRLTEFIKDEEESYDPHTINISPPKEIFFIKDILRPCVYKSWLGLNPKHNFRITGVIELFNHGIMSEQILNVIEHLHWVDYERSYSQYQIDFIENRRKNGNLMIPFGKKKLGCERKGSCFSCILNRID